jgi:hypothetical protein
MLRHHAESALNSFGSSGPTSFALSVLALFSAWMMSSDRAGAASLGSGRAARRLPTPDAALGVVVSWSRIRTIVSCGRTTITTPEPFLGFASLRRLAVEAHSGVAVTAASTAAASEPRRMARHQSRNVVKSSRRRCPTRFPSPIRVLSSLAFSSAETMFSGSFDSGFVVCIGRFVPTSACITRARASPSMNSLACSGRLDTRSRIRFIVPIGSVTTIGCLALLLKLAEPAKPCRHSRRRSLRPLEVEWTLPTPSTVRQRPTEPGFLQPDALRGQPPGAA